MKKIVVVTRSLGAGGAERVIAQLIDQWAETGHACTLILLEKSPLFYETDKKVKIIQIGQMHPSGPVDKLLKYRRVRELIISEAPDLVLSLPEEIGIYTILSMIGLKTPVFVSERNDPHRMPYKKITRLLRRIAYPMADGIVFQSEKAASFFPARIRKKSAILPNPLDERRLPDPWSGERTRRIVTAGRLEPQKNQKLLISAFRMIQSRHPEMRLEIYGSGSLRKELEAFAAATLEKGTCLFMGADKDLLRHINDAAVFVLCSDHEGLPNALLESLACGIPSVTTDYEPGSAPEIIKNGINGLIVPCGDAQRLADAVIRLIEDQGLSEQFSQRAAEIRSRLKCTVVAGEWMSFFESRIRNGM